jgi:small GTP-binding protein
MSVAYNSLDDSYKVVLIGDSGVGKTAILERCTKNTFSSDFVSTVGIDFGIKTVETESRLTKLHIWDTAGQDRFRSIILSYFRGIHVALLVYSIKDAISFNNLNYWYEQVKKLGTEPVYIFIVGNMCECPPMEREVPYKTGEEYAQSIGANFTEVSAKNGTNINSLFQCVVKELGVTTTDKQTGNETTVNLDNDMASKSRCKCCL